MSDFKKTYEKLSEVDLEDLQKLATEYGKNVKEDVNSQVFELLRPGLVPYSRTEKRENEERIVREKGKSQYHTENDSPMFVRMKNDKPLYRTNKGEEYFRREKSEKPYSHAEQVEEDFLSTFSN
jgi:hypothetical protein